MADEIDTSPDFTEQHLAAARARAAQPMPVGAPGECEDCGGDSPRLVGGRCAPCRDGRRR
jgi:hypothetical protein